MKIFAWFPVATIGLAAVLNAAPIELTGMVRFDQPTYRLSADATEILIDETSPEGKRFVVLLNLKTWGIRKTRVLSDLTLLPDTKSGIWNWVGAYEGAPGWVGSKNFITYYHPTLDTDPDRKLQWADRNYFLGVMPDGNFLASDSVTFVKNASGSMPVKIQGLKTIDPATGNTVKVLREDVVIDQVEISYINQLSLIDEGRLLVWRSHRHCYTAPVAGGKAVGFPIPIALNAFAGTLGIGTEHRPAADNVQARTVVRKVIVDLVTGKLLVDVVLRDRPSHLLCATGQDGHIFWFDTGTGELTEEVWEEGALKTLGTKKLDISAFEFTRWQHGDGFTSFQVFVSTSTGKLVVLPKEVAIPGFRLNKLWAWDIKSGEMEFKVTDFFMPHQKFMDERAVRIANQFKVLEKPKPEAAVPKTLPPGSLIQNGTTGFMYILDRFQESTQTWVVVEMGSLRHGVRERRNVQKPAYFFAPGMTRVVSTTPCSFCGGAGAVAGTQKSTNTTVDNYNAHVPGGKVITTQTYDRAVTLGCKECEGTGFKF